MQEVKVIISPVNLFWTILIIIIACSLIGGMLDSLKGVIKEAYTLERLKRSGIFKEKSEDETDKR